jgi:hypothetical protein
MKETVSDEDLTQGSSLVEFRFGRYDLYNYLFYLCFTFLSFSYICFYLKTDT